MAPALPIALFAAAVLLYGGGSVLFYLDVARGSSATREPSRTAPALLAGGAVAHLGYVLLASFVAHSCPVHSIHFFLSMASLLATAVYLGARRRWRIHAVGLILAPVGMVLSLSTFFLGQPAPAGSMPASFIALHVFANLCGAALFLLAGATASLYLIQERRLKRKRAVLSSSLPSLDSLDRAAHRCLLAGFPLLTLGLATGSISARQIELAADDLVRAAFGWATWLLFAGVLLMRAALGWRGRRAAYGTVAGFGCAMVVLLLYALRPLFEGAGG